MSRKRVLCMFKILIYNAYVKYVIFVCEIH